MKPGETRSGPRVAWITGASKGIGRALAKRLAAEGWTIAVSARSAADLDSLAEECAPGSIHPFPLDVTDRHATAATLARIEEALGSIGLAVLNAGTHRPMPAAAFSTEIVRELVEVNLMGTVNCLDPLLERFVAHGGGHVAVVASVAGYRGLPTAAAYGATKAALINMCEALKPELDGVGVRLQVVNPGFVETPLTDRNDFRMPMMISAEAAARHIVRGLRGRGFEIAFPTLFVLVMKLARLLPYRLYFALARRGTGA